VGCGRAAAIRTDSRKPLYDVAINVLSKKNKKLTKIYYMKSKLLFSFLILLTSSAVYAQGTFGEVQSILSTSCAYSSCHDASGPAAGLDFTGSLNDIYDQLINVDPFNDEAKDRGYKLVKPGDPAKSFLYRKMNYGLHEDSNLGTDLGQNMPTGAALADEKIELVRQWILFGANNDEEEYIDSDILEEYYVDGGLDRLEAPPAPDPSEGFQLHLGPIFLETNQEKEYVYRYELQNPEPLEINRIEVIMNEESHHFLFFKYEDGAENNQADGLLEVSVESSLSGEALAITSDTKMIAGWAYSQSFELPEGTAYTWDINEVLKFNYHILNYSDAAVLPAEIYINVYTQPVGTASHEMHSEFHLYSPFNLIIPPGEHEFVWDYDNFDEASNNDTVHVWALGAHTHQYGTDFDIYRQDGGVLGEQVYEGFYNLDYTANIGAYNYSEPAFRIFEPPFLSLKANDGLHIEALYNNTSSSTIFFGLTTQDEMFGLFIQYLTGDISDLLEMPIDTMEVDTMEMDTTNTSLFSQIIPQQWSLYPNPSKDFVNLDLKDINEPVDLVVYNTLGELVYTEKVAPNTLGHRIDLTTFTSGVYFVEIKGQHFSDTQKLNIQR